MDVAEIISDLNDHGFTDAATTSKVRVIQDVIWEIEAIRPWPFLETKTDLSFDGTSGLASNWPTDFRAALKLKNKATGRLLEPVRQDALEEMVGVDLAKVAAPVVYYTEAEKAYLWPVPSNGTSVRMRYLRYSAAISDTSPETAILIPKRHHRVIVLGALIRLYDMEDDPELAARFEGHYENRLQKMAEDLFLKQYDRPDYVSVIDLDLWDYE